MSIVAQGSGTANLAVWVALVTAIGSLGVAVLNNYTGRRREQALESLRQKLSGEQAQLNATLDYKYEALKRLYTELQPLLFQLTETCESSYNRIAGLAETARESAPWHQDRDYAMQTALRLMEPLAIVRLCRERLTVLDLSLDRDLAAQYEVMKQLYHAWTSSRELAAAAPRLTYKPVADDGTGAPAPQVPEQAEVWGRQQRHKQPPRPPMAAVEDRGQGKQRDPFAAQQHQRQPGHHASAARAAWSCAWSVDSRRATPAQADQAVQRPGGEQHQRPARLDHPDGPGAVGGVAA